jgi:hypothetical protein
MSDFETNPLDRRFQIVRMKDPGYLSPTINYELLAEETDKIETWTKQMLNETGRVTHALSLTQLNDVYAKKSINTKWSSSLTDFAKEKVNGRGEVSFKHVVKDRYEITLSYYGLVQVGKMIRVPDVTAAKEIVPILMQRTVLEELESFIPFDDSFDSSELVVGYEPGQLQNRHMQYLEEEIIERMLDDAGFVFSDDGLSFVSKRNKCGNSACVWEDNKHDMMLLNNTRNERFSEPNQRRHAMYRHMALVINGGPSGHGNRMKLPECVVWSARSTFPDPGDCYTGHREVE